MSPYKPVIQNIISNIHTDGMFDYSAKINKKYLDGFSTPHQ